MIRLAITLGDLNGIGPEIALKAVYGCRWPAALRFVFVGDEQLLHGLSESFGFAKPPRWAPGEDWPARCRAVVWAPVSGVPACTPGRITSAASRTAVAWIRHAVLAAQAGQVDGVVTGPICKEGLKKAGLDLPGHTEFLADLTGVKRYAMMLMGGPLRVILATRHVPLSEVSVRLTPACIRQTATLADEGLRWLGVASPRIGVCGLNPHAGDGGALGGEEKRLIAPVVRALHRAGLNVIGPVPSDVIFYQALRGDYDAVVAMYHDQGLGPLKMIAFEEGVNLTLGLPIVRTSPDHGTAVDISGKNQANPASMKAAMRG
ncbi:MAG: 4-hydroxythreonine-4-phosphate dehydrogenase PdxA, partial [Kiritimatiellae bacterium]|nr:4-hydroxythreonine-4-phosphate dehydrogenase PdxA [Kiritimatiellia bacterium]